MLEVIPPRVFISYSHENPEHKTWVLQFAQDLRKNGIDIILDTWHLKLGDDVIKFAESINICKYVLMICTPDFAIKADGRNDGVGPEYRLITGAILHNPSSFDRFIPILRKGTPVSSIPQLMQNKLYSDFRNDSEYSNSLESLIFRVLAEPTAPPLGNLRNMSLPGILSERSNDSEPEKLILVAGVGDEKKIDDRMRKTARNLGKCLADNNYGLISGGWSGIDNEVSRAFEYQIKVTGKRLENFFTQILQKGRLPAFAGGNLIFVKGGIAEWTEGVERCHAIILIHGEGGTKRTAEFGFKYEKPVFPIPDTKGDAKVVYLEMLQNWRQAYFKNITRSEFQSLGGEAPGVLNNVMKLLNKELRRD